jgi:ABC-type proline/glycine betaine transport system substrate-binding protein
MRRESCSTVVALGGVLLFCVAAITPVAQAEVESRDPIKLTIHDWTGQYLTTHIMGEVLKKAGYNIKYVQADYIAQFAGLETGDLHIAMEMWETTGKQAGHGSIAGHRQDRRSRRDRNGCQGRMVVPDVHERALPRPAGLEGTQ